MRLDIPDMALVLKSIRRVAAFSNEEYLQLRDLTLSILDPYDLGDTLFIGLGRSPSALIALMQEISGIRALNLPLARQRPEIEAEAKHALQSKRRLDRHIDRFLPKHFLEETREIVLIDFCRTGETLAWGFDRFSEYAQRRSLEVKVQAAAILHGPLAMQRVLTCLGERTVRCYSVHDRNCICTSFYWQRYDDFAEYPSFVPGKMKSHELLRQSSYDSLCEFLRMKVSFDTELQKRFRPSRQTASYGPVLPLSQYLQPSGSDAGTCYVLSGLIK